MADFDDYMDSVTQALDSALAQITDDESVPSRLATAIEDLAGAVKALAEHTSMPRRISEE